MGFIDMRTIPCLLCGALYWYDPCIPGLREHGMKFMFEHYMREHGSCAEQ